MALSDGVRAFGRIRPLMLIAFCILHSAFYIPNGLPSN
jgi:hypothetical protein